jgi:isochorismate synthase EntC
MDFEGNFNHAIMIRTFLSKKSSIHSQAGAGIVASSDEESEMQAVYNITCVKYSLRSSRTNLIIINCKGI